MKFHYISPSILPSRAANSVHVAMQCAGLVQAGAEVTLYAQRAVPKKGDLIHALLQAYGVDLSTVRMLTYWSRSSRGHNLLIAALAFLNFLGNTRPDVILSRNLYAAYLIGVIARHPLIFETHDIETGIRGRLQKSIMRRPWVRTVCISEQLLKFLIETHGFSPTVSQILHDAAPAGIESIQPEHRRIALIELIPESQGLWRGVCGYFGHLYPGRGIEIIEAMATRLPDLLFLVAGGRDEDISARRARNSTSNLLFLGHLPHQHAMQLAKCVDILLMPYQSSVSVGIAGRDTARWMSPMKMFEYMASGVPIISSDLPVLREVLHDGRNALLVTADDPDAWIDAAEQLLVDSKFAQKLGSAAHAEYKAKYTWKQRAHALIKGP